jgi:hypothetical protein
VLTLFAIPKAFDGPAGLIQQNAVASWVALGAELQIVLVGDDPGIAEAAREAGVEHLPTVARSDHGTPRLDDALARVEAVARYPLRCFLNADIVLLDDFLPAVTHAREFAPAFLMVGRTTDLDVRDRLSLGNASVREALRERAVKEGEVRGAAAIDYFVFTRGLLDPVPPFVIGRARFDNWIVWRARRRGPVIDASKATIAIHQRHDYGHVPGGHQTAYAGTEAMRNEALALAEGEIFTIHDASHILRADGRIRANPGATFRARERLRKAAWKLSHR